jgi:predicted phage baseplate assembly protein
VPISDNLPILDDRSYQANRDEMYSRISRYTPEWNPVWTDLNDSDPGITMIQVFAWLGEMLTYRMNQVPLLNYIKFLQLIGIELRPAQPAYAEITFPVKSIFANPTLIVPMGTMIMTEAPDGGAPIIFETDQSLTCLRAKLVSVLSDDGVTYSLVTSQNDAASSFQPFGSTAQVGSALMLGFQDPEDFPETEFNLFSWVAPENEKPAPVSCGLDTTNTYASGTIQWQCWNGSTWVALSVLRDDTAALSKSGRITLKSQAGVLARQVFPKESRSLYWIRALVTKSQFEEPPKIAAIRTNTMRLAQMETVKYEYLGGSVGRRNQVFKVTNIPVIKDSLTLEIDQGTGWEMEPWTEVEDFLSSGPDDLHFVLNRTTGEIRFGDGINGAIPVANANLAGSNIRAKEYRYGGGSKGNVGANVLNNIRNAVEGIDSNGITNVMASYGGQDEETFDQAKKRAPASVRARCRAVSSDDFETLAKEVANIARAKALPLYHPDYPDIPVPGVVSVVVVPFGKTENPIPSDGTLRTVCEYLNSRRLLTTELYVLPPSYQRVRIVADIVAAPNFDTAAIKTECEQTLAKYFHPLTGGDDGEGWPFGGKILFSRVFQQIFATKGVTSVNSVVINLDGQDQPVCQDVNISPRSLVFSKDHQVTVSYASGGSQ